ncbi:MAG: hypothetical protein M3Y21_05435 [Candidatus Eremiobacteraeota bacterium]|nr:hypothetical protein [Candidatus Eremiobacteraeota bacterium]
MDKNAEVPNAAADRDDTDIGRDNGRDSDIDANTDDGNGDAVIAADDTGMISNERAIVHEDIEDASEP